MLLDKIAAFLVKRKLEKSGQLAELEQMFKDRAAARYNDFEDLWNDISHPMNDDSDKQKQLFFNFQFMLLISLSGNLTLEQVEKIKRITMEFFGIRMSEVKLKIETLSKEIPAFTLRKDKLNLVPDYIELLASTSLEFEDASDPTYDEAISIMPEDLGYPESYALKILDLMGYNRETVELVYPPANHS